MIGAGRGAVIAQAAIERRLELRPADIRAEADQAAVADGKDPAEAVRDQAAVEQEGQAFVVERGVGLEPEGVGARGRRRAPPHERAPPARAVDDDGRGEAPLGGRHRAILDAGHGGAQEAHAALRQQPLAEGPVVERAERDRGEIVRDRAGGRADLEPVVDLQDAGATPRASGTQSGVPHAEVCTVPTSLRSRSRISPRS